MQHFYGSDEIDPETLEDLDLGDDGKVKQKDLLILNYSLLFFLYKRLVLTLKICFIQIEKNLIRQLILTKANTRMVCFYSFKIRSIF